MPILTWSPKFGWRRGSRQLSAARLVSSATKHARDRAGVPERHGVVVCIDHGANGHAKDGHPECPARLEAVVGALRVLTGPPAGGLNPRAPGAGKQHRHGPPGNPPLEPAVEWRRHSASSSSSGRLATDEELGRVHPPAYLAAVRSACSKLTEAKLIDDSTYLSPGSFEECARSTGALLDLLDQLLVSPSPEPPGSGGRTSSTTSTSSSGLGGRGSNSGGSGPCRPPPAAGFALVRPPGHHVLPSRPMGFGVFNTIAVAARYARERHGVERVLIVDFDVHHGNGTQEVFYDDPNTLYISTHQAGLWPYTGKAKEVGAGAGRGATINIPLPGGSGDQAMARAWSRVVLPAAERFRPQLVLVSAGYDAHWRDPLAAMQLTAGTYHWMCAELAELSKRWCPGRLALVLEGGYHAPSLAESVAASLCGLLLLPPPGPLPAEQQEQCVLHRDDDDSCHRRASAVMLPPPGPRELYEEPLARVDVVLEEVCQLHGLL
ncbi:hypothetical protein CHLRE_06g290400v5 [Chlamydomonas reinhardtii]|uniref:Histone deacetylase domain-containing protein n=1 Tax=Chlamydomonas reinhardtii TaxID=3055 RepID=A0A2K3DQ87_CHLRE|nr:uncharacterized protein CHLRE_06g290400v5 [Chlamydomonas reinhardtii]XP_042924119.1 uncharacterized protein CHLRE_06g290400v5 [Chlamydomonas reinhardtii]PNW82704.1 hypothetical protein CHLRE_06g290400v5 [Chlamydomonas reinhardtii]PNW82705.1 hypothetical protein CHLRE_06g290400v5 [Chlamydomonas reinhardtii]